MSARSLELPRSGEGLACNGFEPNTLFFPGEAGALGLYSVALGGTPDLLSVDVRRSENTRQGRTYLYHTDPDRLVIRRARTSVFTITANSAWDNNCYETKLVATHTFDGSATDIDIPLVDQLPAMGWGARIDSIIEEENGDQKVNLTLSAPVDAPVGEYEFKAVVSVRASGIEVSSLPFDVEIVFLFNPWASGDSAYFTASEQQRREYVLGDSGAYWQGEASNYSPRAWHFGPTKQESLEAALRLLDGLSATSRKSAVTVSRRLALSMPNVLEGNWNEPPYVGGRDPRLWTSSVDILKQYLSTGQVKFGQCWVYGGVLTTCLRSIGLPARPITNFQSASDHSPFDGIIKKIWNNNNEPTSDSESIWNFHVWCEAWMGRDDRPGHGGWQVVDGTYAIGPAPVTAVKALDEGNFDTRQVMSEVEATVQNFRRPASGPDIALDATPTPISSGFSSPPRLLAPETVRMSPRRIKPRKHLLRRALLLSVRASSPPHLESPARPSPATRSLGRFPR